MSNKVVLVGDVLKGQEAWVYLVWGVRKSGRCDLVAIATTAEIMLRYEDMGRSNPDYALVRHELVMLDHAFGQSQLPNLLNKRHSGD